MSDEPAEKKIYIDEDWKSKVQAEKEQAEQQTEAPPTPEEPAEGPFPAPSLTMLATTLGLQAMAALGLVPDPVSGKAEAHLHQARHLIDIIQMLQDKTAGNRTPEETTVLDSLLHELRMGFVAVSQQKSS